MSHTIFPAGGDSTAAEHIEDYLGRVDAALQRAGASLGERGHVLENLRSQIIEMLMSRSAGDSPTAADAKAVIQELDLPEQYSNGYGGDAETSAVSGAVATPEENWPLSKPPGSPEAAASAPIGFTSAGIVWFILAAILLPAGALLVELYTRICTTTFFDPIPTVAHALCVAFVPVVFLIGLIKLKRRSHSWSRTTMMCIGMATGISLLYVLPFLPMLPISFVAILAMGVGLLPYAPLGAFLSGFWLRKHMQKFYEANTSAPPTPSFFGFGLLVGAAILMACYLPAYLIINNISIAANGSGTERQAALKKLLSLKGEDEILRLAYTAQNRMAFTTQDSLTIGPWAIFSPGEANHITKDDARKVFYRLTGKPFNSVPPPAIFTSGFGSSVQSFERNPEMRDGSVGWIDKDLTLKSSRIDAIADGATATAYVEWTMTFHNSSRNQREARSQILLPPGGVVSRLTLWVHGEEREAAFSSRGEVVEAYENVVRKRQDPVLITTSGPDRITMQCFPVPPEGLMKIRIGITLPLATEGADRTLLLPRHIERNYEVPDSVKHAVWLDAAGELKGKLGGISPGPDEEGHTRLAGQVSDEELSRSGRLLLAGASPGRQEYPDLREPDKFAIVQAVAEVAQAAPEKLIMVLDTSITAEPYLENVVEACRQLPENMKVHLILAGDESKSDSAAPEATQELTPGVLATKLKQVEFKGGQDSVPALRKAWQLALDSPGSAVVWIHGPQAVELTPPDDLVQLMERSGKRLYEFYEVLLAPGPDRIIGALERHLIVNFIPGVGQSALTELGMMFKDWKTGKPRQQLVRTRRQLADGETPTTSTSASGHVARLWAFDEAMQLFRKNGNITSAIELAVKYQLVTPFTGAVVLETRQQYEEAGLEPVDPGTVPTIPEPEEWALIIIALALLAYGIWKYRALGKGSIAA